jgi:nitrous oxide reductase accessory protein NosL
MKPWLAIVVIGLLTASAVNALEGSPVKPGKKDKCPVCGMFVHRYPDWIAEIVFADGETYFFDGAKDMFKFYFDLKTYAPEKNPAAIIAIYVTEYYDMKFIDAREAFFVMGSDVYGPMGRELIPFAKKADAVQFSQDHKGERILPFNRVTPTVIQKLD